MKARKLLATGLAFLALSACQTITKPVEEPKVEKEKDPSVMSEAEVKEFTEKLKTIDGIKAVVYTCDGPANIIAMYGLDKAEKIVAVKISVGNIVSPPILKEVGNGRNVFRFFDGKIDWSTTAQEGDNLLATKEGKLVLKGHKNLILNHCEVNERLTRDFSKSMGDKLEEHAEKAAAAHGAPQGAETGKSGGASKKATGKAKRAVHGKSGAGKAKSGSKSKTKSKKAKAK